MEFTEMAQDILWINLDGAAAAGAKPRRPPRHDLQCLHWRARGGQHGKSVSLSGENVGGVALSFPVAAVAGCLGEPVTQPADGNQLVFRPGALEYLPDLEDRRVGKPAVNIPLRGHDQARDQAWPHVGKFGSDR